MLKTAWHTRNSIIVFLFFISIFYGCNNSELKQEIKGANDAMNFHEKDVLFLKYVGENYLQGIQIGQLAISNTSNDKIKEMARKIEVDKIKSLDELKELAAKKLILIPANTPFDEVDIYEKMVEKKDKAFDQAYCSLIEIDNKQTINEFEKTLKETNDNEIRTWAQNSLPVLRSQLMMAIECQKTIETNNYKN